MGTRRVVLLIIIIIIVGIGIRMCDGSAPEQSRRSEHPGDFRHLTGPNIYDSEPVIATTIDDVEHVKRILGRLGFVPRVCTNNVVSCGDMPETVMSILKGEQNLDKLAGERPGPSTRALLEECKRRGIPFVRVNEANLYQLGHGRHRKMIEASCTSHTKSIAESIAKDKDLTKHMLSQIDLPVPEGKFVTNEQELRQAYRDMTHPRPPVVIKPYNGNHGNGVITNLCSERELVEAYRTIDTTDIIVERFIEGEDYRVLVVNGTVVAAARRVPPSVTGDGVHTLEELIRELNQDPRRGSGHSFYLSRVEYDDVMRYYLNKQGLNERSVPAKGRLVMLRNNGNLSSGGTAEDVTDLLCPTTKTMCERVARYLQLDVCGIDIVCRDITEQLNHERNGAIIEVNSGPGLRMHLQPSRGQARSVASPIIESLFPGGSTGRIPVIAITGCNGKTTTVNLVAHMLSSLSYPNATVGRTTTNGVYIRDTRTITGDCSGPQSAQAVLSHPEVDVAVLEVARGGILRKGLGYDRSDVGCVVNIGNGDHLGPAFDNATLADLIRTKAVVLQNIRPGGYSVLNMDDPWYDALNAHVPNSVNRIAFSSHDTREIRSNLHTLIYIDGDEIKVNGQTVAQCSRIPLLQQGYAFQRENIMAAIGCVLPYLSHPSLSTSLYRFVSDAQTNPGRLNQFTDRTGRQVTVDYAHNIDAVEQVCSTIATKTGDNRHIVAVFGAAGDRDDKTIRRMCDRLRQTFSAIYYFVTDDTRRGRSVEALFQVMGTKDGFNDEVDAVKTALDTGHDVVCFADNVENVIHFVETYLRR